MWKIEKKDTFQKKPDGFKFQQYANKTSTWTDTIIGGALFDNTLRNKFDCQYNAAINK